MQRQIQKGKYTVVSRFPKINDENNVKWSDTMKLRFSAFNFSLGFITNALTN